MHRIYSPKDVQVSWNGIPITGYSSDTFLEMERNSDVFLESVGADGNLALTKNADLTGEVRITLMQTAQANRLLAAAAAAQQLIGATIPVSNFVVFDPSDSSVSLAYNAYIKTVPVTAYGSDQTSKTWVFGCELFLTTDDLAGVTSTIADVLPPLENGFLS